VSIIEGPLIQKLLKSFSESYTRMLNNDDKSDEDNELSLKRFMEIVTLYLYKDTNKQKPKFQYSQQVQNMLNHKKEDLLKLSAMQLYVSKSELWDNDEKKYKKSKIHAAQRVIDWYFFLLQWYSEDPTKANDDQYQSLILQTSQKASSLMMADLLYQQGGTKLKRKHHKKTRKYKNLKKTNINHNNHASRGGCRDC
jgi:hypothetical protein